MPGAAGMRRTSPLPRQIPLLQEGVRGRTAEGVARRNPPLFASAKGGRGAKRAQGGPYPGTGKSGHTLQLNAPKSQTTPILKIIPNLSHPSSKHPYPNCRNRGSNRSLNQSPKKLSDITVKNRAVPGITEVHQAVCK